MTPGSVSRYTAGSDGRGVVVSARRSKKAFIRTLYNEPRQLTAKCCDALSSPSVALPASGFQSGMMISSCLFSILPRSRLLSQFPCVVDDGRGDGLENTGSPPARRDIVLPHT